MWAQQRTDNKSMGFQSLSQKKEDRNKNYDNDKWLNC